MKMDPIVNNAIDMVLAFMEGIITFVTMLAPSSRNQLDEYCNGMVFGLEGSKLLVRVANMVTTIRADKADGGKNKPSNFLSQLAKGFAKTASDTMESVK